MTVARRKRGNRMNIEDRIQKKSSPSESEGGTLSREACDISKSSSKSTRTVMSPTLWGSEGWLWVRAILTLRPFAMCRPPRSLDRTAVLSRPNRQSIGTKHAKTVRCALPSILQLSD
jgi:hypothetical protein